MVVSTVLTAVFGKTTALWRVLKALWLLACVSVLAHTLIHHGLEHRDAGVALFLTMLALSFPSGWLSLVMLKLLEMLNLFDISKATELQTILIAWITLFVLGYLQWFVIVPAIVRWWRRRFGNPDSSSFSFTSRD
jgi:hypothetical protein